MASAATADAKVLSPPPLPPPGPDELARLDLAAARTLMYLCLASTWIGCASAGAAALILVFRPSLPFIELFIAAMGADFVSSVFALAVMLRLLRSAVRCVDSRANLIKSCGPVLRGMVIDTAVPLPDYFEALFLMVLSSVGCLVLLVKLPDESGAAGTVIVIFDVVVVASAVVSCFLTVPRAVLKLWRMKPGGVVAGGCIV